MKVSLIPEAAMMTSVLSYNLLVTDVKNIHNSELSCALNIIKLPRNNRLPLKRHFYYIDLFYVSS